jgi:hypothetical protein
MQALDEIDKGLLKSIQEHPGQNASEILTPFLDQRTETPLRHRLRRLVLLELVRIERGMTSTRYFPKKEGNAVI